MIEYNSKTVYECLNNTFPVDGVRSDFNLPHITIDDSPRLNKRYRYTSDTIPAAISVTSGNYGIMLTTPSDSPKVIVLDSDDTNTHHNIMNYNPCCARSKRG